MGNTKKIQNKNICEMVNPPHELIGECVPVSICINCPEQEYGAHLQDNVFSYFRV